jgi:mannosyl-oligosaccharide alpha-1,2-mannosidase
MEFTRLSQVTGDEKYEAAARKALDFLEKVIGPKLRVAGLYPVYISVQDKEGQINEREYSLGAMADSFYEYLLKMYVMTGDTQSKRMFDQARPALVKYLYKKSNQGVYYFGQGSLEHPDSNFQHLTCFAAGMFALNVISGNSDSVQEDTEIGANITETCHYMYASSDIGISPDSVYMDSVDFEPRSIFKRSLVHNALGKRSTSDEKLHIAKSSLIAAREQAETLNKETTEDPALAKSTESKEEVQKPPPANPIKKNIKLRANNPPYFQRPEAIEAMFYMWRLTKKEIYRDWVWEIVLKIEEHTKRGVGYTGLNNANYDSPSDRQDSFFLAESKLFD